MAQFGPVSFIQSKCLQTYPLTGQLQGPRCEKDRTVILHVHGEVYFLNHMQDFITHAGTIKILMEKPGFSLVRRGKTKETECVGKKYWK